MREERAKRKRNREPGCYLGGQEVVAAALARRGGCGGGRRWGSEEESAQPPPPHLHAAHALLKVFFPFLPAGDRRSMEFGAGWLAVPFFFSVPFLFFLFENEFRFCYFLSFFLY
jgi:hypothetical protein